MRLLLLNWRDPWHPRAGGAEHLTHRILERLAKKNWNILWFSGAYPGARPDELRDGIRFVRAGSACTVHVLAFLRFGRTKEFDYIIDQINTIPFLTPLYQSKPIVWFQQLAREVWLYEGGLIGPIGYLLEALYLRPYRNTAIITISKSTLASLHKIGLRGKAAIIPIAVDEPVAPSVPIKDQPARIVVLGRVTPSKRIEESIKAAKLLSDRGWNGTLQIVGSGQPRYRDSLIKLCRRLSIGEQVQFLGRVTDEERGCILRRASAIWMTSVREGWGMVITEAARCATPAVVYDVPGLRDSVKHGRTGYVVPPSPRALAESTEQLLGDFDTLALRTWLDSREYSWEKTTKAFETALEILSRSS